MPSRSARPKNPEASEVERVPINSVETGSLTAM